jgi:FtsH-binding integral membrane protein
MDELTRVITSRIEEQRRLYQENQAFQALRDSMGLTAANFENGLDLQRRTMELLLPSLFALQWLIVIAVNGWLASVLFENDGGFPSFSRFVTWRVHPVGAWLLAASLALMVVHTKAAFIAGVNLAFPLALAYTIQGFAVARFMALALDVRGVVQAGVILLFVLMPVLVLAVTTVGLLDAWYDFRTMLITGSRPSRSDEGSGD